MAGIAIFPAVFAFGIEPGSGEGLVYITLPNIFQQMVGGYIFSLLFFLLLGVAALTSTISVLEVIVAYFVEELKISRKKATWVATGSVSVLGVMCTLSWGAMKDIEIFGKNVFALLDFLSANIFLPLGGLLIVVFVGWVLGKQKAKAELSNEGLLKVVYFPAFMLVVKFIAPIAIALVFLYQIGLISF